MPTVENNTALYTLKCLKKENLIKTTGEVDIPFVLKKLENKSLGGKSVIYPQALQNASTLISLCDIIMAKAITRLNQMLLVCVKLFFWTPS